MDGGDGADREPRAGAGRLAVDLSAVENGMGELYDAASGAREPSRPRAPHSRRSFARRAFPPPRQIAELRNMRTAPAQEARRPATSTARA